MSGAHSVFQTPTAFSVSDGSSLMWMRRMMDIAFLLAAGWACDARITHTSAIRLVITLSGSLAVLEWRVK
jgi:hypothetical protein